MKIIATSDLHGNFPLIEEPFDLLLIAGDVCPTHDQNVHFQKNWIKEVFPKWINALPYANPWSMAILVPGNHDFGLERLGKQEIEELEHACEGHLKFLRHSMYDFEFPVSDGTDTLTIFGTPYCSVFGFWAFMITDDSLERKFSQIPEGVDILISHDSPNIGKLGAITQGKWKSDTTGNKILAKHIERIHPKLFVSGHFHSGNHEPQMIGETLAANVSYVDESYYPTYQPLVINYNEEDRTFSHDLSSKEK